MFMLLLLRRVLFLILMASQSTKQKLPVFNAIYFKTLTVDVMSSLPMPHFHQYFRTFAIVISLCGAFIYSHSQQVVLYQQNFDGNNGTYTNTLVSQTGTNGWIASSTAVQYSTYRHVWNFSNVANTSNPYASPITGRSLGMGFYNGNNPNVTNQFFRTWDGTNCSILAQTTRWVHVGVSTVGYKDIQVEFKWRCNGEVDGGVAYDYGTVITSVNGGTNWLMDETGGAAGVTGANGTYAGGLYHSNTGTQTQVIELPATRNDNANFRLGFRMVVDECYGTGGGFIIDDIIIRGTPITACVAGTATGPAFVTTGSTATLSLTGQVGSIQWQSSPNGSTGWADVVGGSGANTANYVTSSIPNGTYYYRAVVTDGSCTAYSNTITILSAASPVYCSGVGTGNAFSNNHLESVSFHEWVDPNPGNFSNNYLNYTDTSLYGYATVVAGQYHHLNALIRANGTATNGTTFAYWIDWNGDGTFNNTLFASGGERMDNVFYTSTAGNTYASYFTVPQTALGMLRIRLRVVRGNTGALDPCTAYSNSQTKDFMVKVIPSIGPQVCNGVNGGADVVSTNTSADKVYINRVQVTGPGGNVMTNNSMFFGVQAGATISMYNYTNFMGAASKNLVMQEGSPYTVAVEHSGYTTAAGLFIDYNGDGDFNDANELVGRISNPNMNPFVFNFNIPPNVQDGKQVAMRVRLRYDDLGNLGNTIHACNNISDGLGFYSEVEDYRITLKKLVSPLPVELISFDAACHDGKVELSWATASEQNNDYFLVEQSSDLINWELVGRQYGNGNSNSTLHYSIVDNSPSSTLIRYYRLTQVDYDGTKEIFHPISLGCGGVEKPEISLYPNPAHDTFIVTFTVEKETTLQMSIIDMAGKTVMTKSLHAQTGENNFGIDAYSLAPGQYVVQAYSTQFSAKPMKLVIQ